MAYVLVAVIGMCVGSFLNVAIHRLPRRESTIWPRSRCATCGHPLAWLDMLPVLSFVLYRRRCRYCEGLIGWHYPAVEIAAALCSLGAVAAFGWTFAALKVAVLCCLLLAAAEIDRRHGIVPNRLAAVGALLGVLLGLAAEPGGIPSQMLAAAVLVGLLLVVQQGSRLAFGRVGMGMGDVKLVAMTALFLGWETLWVLYLAIVAAAVVGVVGVWGGRLERGTPLPFAPFVAAGAVLDLFWLTPSLVLPY